MKIKLTEQDINKMVLRAVNEAIDALEVERGTNLHFLKASNTAERMRRFEKLSGWKVIGYQNEGERIVVVLYPDSEKSYPIDRAENSLIDWFPNLKDIDVKGNRIKLYFETSDEDYENSRKYAQEKWDNNKAWKTPWDLPSWSDVQNNEREV